MALLTTQRPTTTGLAPTYAAASAGGDTVSPSSGTSLVVKNAGGSSINVTITDGRSVAENAQSYPSIVVAVPATTGERWIALPSAYAGVGTGVIAVAYSGVTSVTVAAVASATFS